MLGSLILLASLAVTESTDAGHCVEMTDDAERLACYDVWYRTANRQARLEERDEQLAPMPASADAAVIAPDKQQNFGWSAQQRAGRDGVEEADEIEAVIITVRQDRPGKPSYVLDNGQRWRQVEASAYPKLKSGKIIVIRKAAIGSFLATMREGGSSVRIRREE